VSAEEGAAREWRFSLFLRSYDRSTKDFENFESF
jgi:hypothetical protein